MCPKDSKKEDQPTVIDMSHEDQPMDMATKEEQSSAINMVTKEDQQSSMEKGDQDSAIDMAGKDTGNSQKKGKSLKMPKYSLFTRSIIAYLILTGLITYLYTSNQTYIDPSRPTFAEALPLSLLKVGGFLALVFICHVPCMAMSPLVSDHEADEPAITGVNTEDVKLDIKE